MLADIFFRLLTRTITLPLKFLIKKLKASKPVQRLAKHCSKLGSPRCFNFN